MKPERARSCVSTAMVNQYYVYAVHRDFGPFFLKFCCRPSAFLHPCRGADMNGTPGPGGTRFARPPATICRASGAGDSRCQLLPSLSVRRTPAASVSSWCVT
jgi:hypothetical protein